MAINLFDRVLKILGRHYAESFLKLAFPASALQLVGTLENVELTLPDRRIDFLHRLKVSSEEYLLHFEFQLEHKTDYPRDVFTYSGELTDQHKKPVISIVLVMLAKEKTESVLRQEKELILQETDPQKRAASLATAVMIASRYFDIDRLWDFFSEEVEQMRQSGFITDWIEEAEAKASERGLQHGLQQGLQQGKQTLILRLLRAKFGRLPKSVKERILGMTSEEELDLLGIRILTAKSLQEMGLDGGRSNV